MQQQFEFRVEQRQTGPGVHSWVAIERCSGVEIDLHKGGNRTQAESLVGQYPEIQEYLLNSFQINVLLIYVTQLDELRIDSDGTSHWTFRRHAAQVTVHDIPRVVWHVQVS